MLAAYHNGEWEDLTFLPDNNVYLAIDFDATIHIKILLGILTQRKRHGRLWHDGREGKANAV